MQQASPKEMQDRARQGEQDDPLGIVQESVLEKEKHKVRWDFE